MLTRSRMGSPSPTGITRSAVASARSCQVGARYAQSAGHNLILGIPFNLTPIDFHFEFRETPNATPAQAPRNALCGSFRRRRDTHAERTILYDTGDDGAVNYFASIFVPGPNNSISPISTLLPGECTALGLSAGCQGFRTAELEATTAQFAFAITMAPLTFVPETGALNVGTWPCGHGTKPASSEQFVC